MTQSKIILCQSVRVMSRPVSVSTPGKCAECDIRIWLAPSSVRLLNSDPEVKSICELCAQSFLEKTSDPVVFAILPDAIREALAHFKKVETN